LIVTGGGTGGHVFPALEVARFARDRQVHVAYFGSFRGQEAAACRTADIPFVGFPSGPVYSVKTPKGWAALVQLARARQLAKRELRSIGPDCVFSTGGYSSAPVVSAAHALRIPVVIHEQNAVPGRTNLMLAKRAYAIATTFHAAAKHFEGLNVVRTGLPVRRELREIATTARSGHLIPFILVVGGSQGAMAINEAALGAAKRMVDRSVHWLHVTGPKNFQDCYPSYERLGLKDSYQMHGFLHGAEMGNAYASASLVVGRSGAATLSEIAAFRLPSVLTPYPHAYANHQAHNAMEFAEMGAARIVEQSNLHPAELESNIANWLDNLEAQDLAAKALEDWDLPNADQRIFELIQFGADQKRS
jgi:UDP-N-acetylglucosamine--N-acetylmuramyl-(pentapeptide) pyrophosphoryl-undecaprenol N-acetylglucosamine transferase